MLALLGRRLAAASATEAAAGGGALRRIAASRAVGDLREFLEPDAYDPEDVSYGAPIPGSGSRAKHTSISAPAAALAGSSGVARHAHTAPPLHSATAAAAPDRPLGAGRPWMAHELRLKSWDDLHKLWCDRRGAAQGRRAVPAHLCARACRRVPTAHGRHLGPAHPVTRRSPAAGTCA